MGRDDFLVQAREKIDAFFSTITDKSSIKHISHLDADGLSAAALIVQYLYQNQYMFCTTIVPSLDEKTLLTHVGSYTHYIISDLGSGQLELLKKYLADKHVLILDHHDFEHIELPAQWMHINPRSYGFNGDDEVSGAGVSYLAILSRSPEFTKNSHIALIGAMGDVQHKESFIGLNSTILDDACAEQKIRVMQTLNYFGVSSKQLVHLLEYGDGVYIPGVTGVRGGAVKFLSELNIHHELGGKPIKLKDLSAVEYSRLTNAILKRREEHNIQGTIYQKHYSLIGGPDEGPTSNIKEFATLLNACGRMKKFAVGVGACLQDSSCLVLAKHVEEAYKKKISEAIQWYKSTTHERTSSYVLINGGTTISATIIGTLASIAARQPDISAGTLVISLARNVDEGTTKVSVRRSGDVALDDDSGLQSVVKTLCSGIEAQAGGHTMAAGAVFSSDFEEQFLGNVRSTFGVKVSAPEQDVL